MKNSFILRLALFSLCIIHNGHFIRSEAIHSRIESFSRDSLARFSDKSVRNADSRIREVRMEDQNRMVSPSDQARVRTYRESTPEDVRVTMMTTRRVSQQQSERPEAFRMRMDSRRSRSLNRFETTERRLVRDAREERRMVRSDSIPLEQRIADRQVANNEDRRVTRMRNDNSRRKRSLTRQDESARVRSNSNRMERDDTVRASRVRDESRQMVREEGTRVRDETRRMAREDATRTREMRVRDDSSSRVRDEARRLVRDETKRVARQDSRIRDEAHRLVRDDASRSRVREESRRMAREDSRESHRIFRGENSARSRVRDETRHSERENSARSRQTDSRRHVRDEERRLVRDDTQRVVREATEERRIDNRRILSSPAIEIKRISREVRDVRVSEKENDNNRMIYDRRFMEARKINTLEERNFGKFLTMEELHASPKSEQVSTWNQLTSAVFGGAALLMLYSQSKKQKVE